MRRPALRPALDHKFRGAALDLDLGDIRLRDHQQQLANRLQAEVIGRRPALLRGVIAHIVPLSDVLDSDG
jgi:hypothetical protein